MAIEKRVQAFVDRIEGDCATLLLGDEGRPVCWPVEALPENAGEGSFVSITLTLDEKATKAAEDVIDSLIDRLEHGI